MEKQKENITKEIERFLEIPHLEFLEFDTGKYELHELLSRNEIEMLIPDRAPFLVVDKVIIFHSKNDEFEALGRGTVSLEKCRGHFPECPIVPLAIVSQFFGLMGTILISWILKDPKLVILAVSADQVRTTSKDVIKAPVDILIEAKLLSRKLRYYQIDTKAWTIKGEPIAEIKKIGYISIEKKHLFFNR